MLYAILSDVHANPDAFRNALADARRQGAKKIICLGDLVGYGPDAAASVALAQEACDVVVMGNHDAATTGVISPWNFRPEAQDGVRRHREELSAEALDWLRTRPYVYRGRGFAVAHGTLDEPESFGYIFNVAQAWGAFKAMGRTRLLFVGHTHSSMWCTHDADEIVGDRCDLLTLRKECPYIVNVGSVGYPRCEPESVYALYDSIRRTVTWRRLPFNFDDYFAQMAAKNIHIASWLKDRAREAAQKENRPC